MNIKKKKEDFLHQERSVYNKQSGKKTLVLVGILILFVTVLSVATILMI
ncbi:MAG TPA: hypothetical protein VND99_04010 [Candidatus Acidoferrales bacterium]|nr:hypothetical protein [Candidatus Acidoferrales bacterium]